MHPLLVTGLPRSGTSWVGKMLEASGEAVYVNEPLNPEHPPGRSPGVLNADVRHRYQYICDDNESDWLPAFRDTVSLRYQVRAELRRNRGLYDIARLGKYATSFTVGRLRGRRALLDDPFALFSTRWLVERLGCRAVVLVRDPLAVVGSWKRLGWQARPEELAEQPLLVRDLLSPYVSDLRLPDTASDTVRLATLWNVAYDVVRRHFADLPGVRVQTYEDLVTDPVGTFAEVYRHCDLPWSDRVEQAIRAATSGAGGVGAYGWTVRFGLSKTAFRPMDSTTALESARSQLNEQEAAQVHGITADVARHLYATASASSPAA
jgi:sulfotransferase family protein